MENILLNVNFKILNLKIQMNLKLKLETEENAMLLWI